jgi:hypothetical protein
MAEKMVDTKLGYREAWHCDCCDEFYSERRLKRNIVKFIVRAMI